MFLTDLTELSIEGDNKTNLEVLVKKIGYSNSREFPTPGRRNLHLSTVVMCDRGRPIKVPPVESYIMVLQPQQPSIEINGTTNLARDYQDFRNGVRVFTDLHISVQPSGKMWKHGESMSVIQKKLDSCIVSVYPSLNPDHESLTLPENMLTQFGIVAKISKDGATVSGSDIIYNYEEVLRQIQYTNRKPAYYLNRVFKLICSEMNGRFLSNEYVQTLTVIHPRVPTAKPSAAAPTEAPAQTADKQVPAHLLLSPQHVKSPVHTIVDHYLETKMSDRTQAVIAPPGHAVTIIIVVCVGFLLFMIVLGVVRIRAAHHRATQEEIQDTEMAWDDSALTITVNPMEQLESPRPGKPGTHGQSHIAPDDDESSDDNSSYHDDDLDSTDEEEEGSAAVSKVKDLEWDNSTLAI
ncbi:Calsyntenin-2 [Homalodisca vitripennis]|nr:Calsyntenin-2 [Homalodisca vitripennis]